LTLRPLPRSRLDGLMPSLAAGQHLLALVPMTGDSRWAASAAWSVARAAAQRGRRVLLVDLGVDHPELHTAVGLPLAAGIVDALQAGDDLTKVAREVDGVFFVPAGSPTSAPEFVLAHPRWNKLHAGFRAEDALLLVYVPSASLARLGAPPDGVIVLAPEGLSLESPASSGLLAAQTQGVALLGVVRERWTPVATPQPAAAHLPARDWDARPRRRRGLVTAAVLSMGVIGAGAWVVFTVAPPDTGAPAAAARAAPAPAPAPGPQPERTAVADYGPDTLAWTVQLAAYGTLDNALAHADRLARERVTAFVAPVEAAQAVWYRVLVGAFPSRDSAAAARSRLWTASLARRGEGELLRAPYSLLLWSGGDVDSLRRLGVPVSRARGGERLLVGAFESPEQAALAQAQLRRAGVAASLIARLEDAP
jgi:hypothetical protein